MFQIPILLTPLLHPPLHPLHSPAAQPASRPTTAFTFLASSIDQRSDEPAASTITFSDGRPSLKLFSEVGRDDADQQLFFRAPANAMMRSLFAISEQPSLTDTDTEHSSAFPTWFKPEGEEMQLNYHSRVKLEHGESLLVDTGCIDALAGSEFIA